MRRPVRCGQGVVNRFLAGSAVTLLAFLSVPLDAGAGPYRDQVIADGAVAYWRLDDTAGLVAADVTGQNPAIYTGGVSLNQPGSLSIEPDPAASFDGIDDSASAPDSSTLDLTAGATIEAWIKRAKLGTQVVLGKPGTSSSRNENYSLWLGSAGNVKAQFGNGSSYVQLYGPALDTSWHHVVATYDNAVARLYVDGVLMTSKTSSVRLTANGDPLTIGTAFNSGSYHFGGVLDELAIYPTALSAERIAVHHETGLSTDLPPVVTLTSPQPESVHTSPTLTFGGAAGSEADDFAAVTVKVYAGGAPMGTPVYIVTAPRQSDGSYTASATVADGTWTARAEQSDAAGNTGLSAPVTFAVDSTAPTVAFDSGPAGPTGSARASFAFSANESGVVFACRLDAGPFAPCASPQAYADLAEGQHAFQVQATDAAGNTGAAAERLWTVDLSAPTVAIESGPPDPTNATAATFTFASEAGASFACSLDAAAFSACASPQAYADLAEGQHAFQVQATDAAGNTGAAASRLWTVDLSAPTVAIESGPPAFTNSTSATLAFSTEPGASLACRLDGAPFVDCSSPQTYTALAEGGHAFEARATDAAGNTGAAAERLWTVDLSAPTVAIESGPPAFTNSTSATLAFSTEPGASLACRLDGAPFVDCSSPQTYTALAEGGHAFEARATDAAGNVGPAERRTWTVDTSPPAATIESGPSDPSSATGATFTFSSESGVSFACSLDGASFTPCSSPETYSDLADGQHTFDVRATDEAGNTGDAARHSWTIQAGPLVVTIESGPSDPSTESDATFVFSGDGAGFACSLDGSPPVPCSSPRTYTGLAEGPHSFEVGASDGDPASWTWTVDLTAPVAQVRSGPELTRTTSTSATFTFIAEHDLTASFECNLDGSPFEPCTSPKTFSGLSLGQHTFRVKAIDPAGNFGPEDVSSWLVEAPRPAPPAIGSAPAAVTSATSATLAFSTSEAVAGFECGLDGAPPTACVSPASYSGLGDGRHTFEVRAVDAAGAKGDSAFHRWTVDTTAPPAATFSSAPPDPSGSPDASFVFSATDAGLSSSFGTALPGLLPESIGPTFYVATTGSDDNPGTLVSSWRSVQKALSTLQPGERALVREGTYVQNLRMTRSGTASNPITVEPYPGETVVLRAAATVTDNYPIEVRGGAYFRLRGFIVEGATGPSTTNVFLSSAAHHVEISNNVIRNSEGQGIFTDNDTFSAFLIGNYIHDNGSALTLIQDHGIYTEGADHLIANNVIHDHPFGFGIQVYPENHGTIVVGNTVVRSGKSGMVVGGSGGVYDLTIRNNVLAFNDDYGVETGTCPIGPVLVDTNVIYGYSEEAVKRSCQYVDTSAGNVLVDPLFVDAAANDFRVLPASPVLERARSEFSLLVDAAGDARPVGPFADLGAFEAPARAECRLDGPPFMPCASPQSFGGLADARHTFEVRTVDSAGNAGVGTHSWTISTATPGEPTIDSGPPALTSSREASLMFSHADSTVSFECRLDGAAFAACTSLQGYSTLADGQHVFEVRAVSITGIRGPVASHTWEVDATPPPTPTITSAPPDASDSADATFAFSSEAGATFACSLDGAAFGLCATPVSYTGLADGTHVFQVRALDAAGNASPVESRSWTIITAPPAAPTIDSGPAALTASTSVTLEFSHPDPAVTLECRLDGSAFATCTSPQAYAGLPDGPHTFEVRARNAVGLASDSATHSWDVDATPPPAPTVSSSPPDPSPSRDATFTFSSAGTIGFECRLDGAAFASCSSPVSYGGLADGSHAFEARATDQAGNWSAVTTYTWTIQIVPAYRGVVLADGPRGYWRLGETSGTVAADEVGATPGTYENGVTLGVPGAIAGDANAAVRLDGSDDRVNVGDPADGHLDFGSGDFTVEAWVRATANGERTIIAKKPSSERYWNVTVTDDPGHLGGIRVQIYDGSTTRLAYGPVVRVDDGAWHHVVVLFDRDTGITVVVDGTALMTPGAMTGDVSNSAALLIGKATGYGYFRGDLDEVAVYPALLSTARIQAHYDAGRGAGG